MSIVISSGKTYNNPNIRIATDNKTSGVNVNSYQIIESEQSQEEISEERNIVTRVFGSGYLITHAGIGYLPNYVHRATKPVDRYDYLLTTITITLAYDYTDGSGNKPYENLKYADKKDISVSISQTGTKSDFLGKNTKYDTRYSWTQEEQNALNQESKYYNDRYSSSLQKVADIIANEVEDMSGKITYKTAQEEVEKLLAKYEYIGSRKSIFTGPSIVKYDNRISITIKFVSKMTHVTGKMKLNPFVMWFERGITDYTFNNVKIDIQFNYKKPEKLDFEHTIGNSDNNIIDSDESFLYHEGNYINDNIDLYQYNANKIIEEYKDGRQVISMEVPITQYFDENGNQYYVNSDNELLLDTGNHLLDENGGIKYTLKDMIENSGIHDITPENGSNLRELIGNSEKIIALNRTSSGFTGGSYYLSTNGGDTWTLYNFPEVIKNAEIKMDFGYGLFAGIAFDYNGDKIPYLINSYNGIDWNIKALDVTSELVYTEVKGHGLGYTSVAVGAGVGDGFGYYLIDALGRLYKSREKAFDNLEFLLTIDNNFNSNSIAFGQYRASSNTLTPRFIVVGDNGYIYIANSGYPASFSDWKKITSGITANLNSVCVAVDGFLTLRFVAVGDNGTILHIVNNSETATTVNSPTKNNLNSIIKIGGGALAVGDNGTILYSTDLGQTFTLANSPTSENLKSVSFVSTQSESYYLAVGDNGTVVYSTDAINWQIINTDTTENLNAVAQNFIYGDNSVALKFNSSEMNTVAINSPKANSNILYAYSLGSNDIAIFSKLHAFSLNTNIYFTPTLMYANYNFFFFDDKIIYISKDGMDYKKYNSNISGTKLDILGYMNNLYIAYSGSESSYNQFVIYTSPDLQNWTKKILNLPSGFSPTTVGGRNIGAVFNDILVIYGKVTGGSIAIAYSKDLLNFAFSQLETDYTQSYIVGGIYNSGIYTIFSETPDSIMLYMSKNFPEFDITYGIDKTTTDSQYSSFLDCLAYYNDLLVLSKGSIKRFEGLGTFKQALNLLDKFPLSKGMVCLPMYRHNGKNIPIITNKVGDGKKFIVISSEINYTGNLTNSITIEEDITGNNESVKYLSFDKETNAITGLSIPSDIQYFELDIPSSIEEIDVYSIANNFATNNSKIYSLKMPFTVKTIGANAFSGCTTISNQLELPHYIKTIGANAFSGCTGIKGNIIIPDYITSIGDGAFQNCTGLDGYVSFPQSVKSLTANVLNGCSNLKYIIMNSDTISSSSGDATAFANTNNCPIYVPDEALDLYKSVLTGYSTRIKSINEIL